MLTRNENASDHIRLRLVVLMLAWNTCGHQEMWLDVLSISYATYWKPSSKHHSTTSGNKLDWPAQLPLLATLGVIAS